jgi:hypothetical protein
MTNTEPITYFAETDFRGKHQRFGIRRSDRQYHTAIVGRTGMGKSTLLETLMVSDVHAGNGFALLDPHGDTAETIVKLIPPERQADLVYFNPADPNCSIGLNILEGTGQRKHLVVSGVISLFKKIWAESWGPRMEHIFRYALASLIEVEGTTLADVSRILLERDYRAYILSHVDDATIKDFWTEEFDRYTPSFRTEAISPILNKTGSFLVHKEIREVVAKKKSDFDLRQIMDEGKIFIANLSKGKLGEDGSALLGSLLSTKFELAALSRTAVPIEQRRDFVLYVDEFPSLAGSSFIGMLSESRKYKLALVLAMQFVEQLEEPVRNALFENVGTLISFRVGPETARFLGPQFAPVFSREDLMNLGRYSIYIRLMVSGIPSRPFSARTLPPATTPPVSLN